MREATISTGIWLTYGVGGLGEVYVSLTLGRSNRPLLALLFGLAVLAGIFISLLPRERIVRSRYREHFFLTWTMMDFLMIVLGTLADGGTDSPLVLVLFLPVIFSSMSYPLGSVLAVGFVSVISYLALALTAGGASAIYQGAFVTALACTAAMSAWQAQNHNRQHLALGEASRADPLTGCLNRRGFEERAIAEISAMSRHGRRGAVMVLDIDHFKPVNDTHGHAAGDELLRWVVATLNRVVRPADAVGRLGGDEFGVLFPEIEPEDALRSVERIKQALAERAPASVGTAMFPRDGSELEELARVADMRLYASRSGRPEPARPAAAELGGELVASAGPPEPDAFWQTTLDSLAARVAVLDESGVIVAVNAAWRRFAGRAGGDCGTDYVQLCASSEAAGGERFACGLREILAGERSSLEAEYSCPGPSSRRWYSTRATRFEGVGPVRVVVAQEDVSDGRQAREQTLVEAALLDQIDAAVIVTDLEQKVISWNNAAESLYGFTREQAIGMNALELVVAEADKPPERVVSELLRVGRGDSEFLMRRRDGSCFSAYVRSRTVCGEDGAPVAIVGVSLDISERAAAEGELVRSRNTAQAVAECMGEGLITLDDHGCITYLNPAAEQMLGWPAAELHGQVMHEVIHSRSACAGLSFEECPITRSCREAATLRVDDDLFTRRGGGDLAVSYTAAPFQSADEARGSIVVFRDVAERKQREDERLQDLETLACLDRVEAALAEDRLVLHAQPIVDLRSGRTVQHELLLRMRERDGRIEPPGSFLPVAEQYALIGEIDWWVIKRSVQIAAAGCPVELNLSARSIGDVDVLEHIERCIEQSGVDPSRLVFEITETAIIADEAAARAFAERLHELGCRIVLDDFGTGYGGFTYLKQIPVDCLKIDIEFVRDLLSSEASRHVVRAVVALARNFDIQTVAEGVEDGETLELLRELGVDLAQGFHIARPAHFDELPGDVAQENAAHAAPSRRPSRRALRSRRASPALREPAAE